MRRYGSLCGSVLLVSAFLAGPAFGQTPSQNINIVSGPVQVLKDPVSRTVTILGDPFLQRQNEPSIGVSTVNPLHLLAGSNDYRSVDIPFPDVLPSKLVGDAWCGWYFSADGGQSWQSTLLPGFPQDNTALGLSSPLKSFKACADPTVRTGPAGMFFYSGIAFNRDTNSSVVFVSRFLDRNNAEKGSVALNSAPIRYVDTVVVDTGTSGQFLDKPWNAVYLKPGTGTCTIQVPGEAQPAVVPAMAVYVVWSRFTGANSSKIMITKSESCGAPGTFNVTTKVSESNSVNQGTTAEVNQATGNVHLAWRRFKTSSQSDAILSARCADTLKSCSKSSEVTAQLPAPYGPYRPFDQPSTATNFRTNSLPTMAISVDQSNVARVHVAFAARNAAGDARVLMATSLDGLTWTGSQIEAVDADPIVDDKGAQFSRGHQIMPAMTFTEGKLVLAYYFSHFDHTVGLHEPNSPFAPDPATGKFFIESRDPRGELLTNPAAVYASLDDALMTQRRHTVDVRLAQADVDDPQNVPFTAPYRFTQATVSSYVFGFTGTEPLPSNVFQDLQANPPSLSLFGNGQNAFIGDYIDVAGLSFVKVGGVWKANSASSKSAVHYVVWADNRDVRPPRDGNYANFTPVGSTGGQSIFDPSQNQPTCAPGQEGIKDQNVYMSRITQGFLLSAPQNMKPLGQRADGSLFERAFSVIAQNFTGDPRYFRLTIGNQPADAPAGRASFVQAGLVTSLDVLVPARSGIARTVFARSGQADASINVNAAEISGPAGAPVAGGFSGFAVLNPPGTVTALTQPIGVPASLDINTVEVYNPSIKSPSIKSPSIKSPSIKSPSIKSPSIKSPSIKSTSIAEVDPELASTTTTDADEIDPNTSSAALNQDAPVTDATYVVSNEGNTTSTYSIKIVGNAPADTTFQLIISRPTASAAGLNCTLVEQQQNIVEANITTVAFGTDISQLNDPNVTDPNTITVSVPPRESRLITLRGLGSLQIIEEATEMAAPALVSQGTNTDGAEHNVSVPLLILSSALPAGTVGLAYDFTVQTIGGTAPLQWEIISGVLPAGLSFDPGSGRIFGTPSIAGDSSLRFQVSDAATPDAQVARRTLALSIAKGGTTTTITSDDPDPSLAGQPYEVKVTVAAAGTISPLGSVSVDDGTGATCEAGLSADAPGSAKGSCLLASASGGVKTLTASYPGDPAGQQFTGSADTETHVVKVPTTTTITADAPDASILEQSYVVSWSVTPETPATTPTGTVTVANGGSSCSAAVAAGSCTLSSSAVGLFTLTATYSGDAVHQGSSDTEAHQVVYRFEGFLSPLSPAGTVTSPSSSGTANLGSTVPLKWTLTDYSNLVITDLSSLEMMTAQFDSNCTGPADGAIFTLYSPTSGATGGSTFRFATDQFIFNWDTTFQTTAAGGPGAGCYVVAVQLKDKSAAKATRIRLE